MEARATRFVRQTRTQAEVEISRCFDDAETADNLPQFGLLLVKLATVATLAQMLRRTHTAIFANHQLFELAANCFTFCFSHNFLTYK